MLSASIMRTVISEKLSLFNSGYFISCVLVFEKIVLCSTEFFQFIFMRWFCMIHGFTELYFFGWIWLFSWISLDFVLFTAHKTGQINVIIVHRYIFGTSSKTFSVSTVPPGPTFFLRRRSKLRNHKFYPCAQCRMSDPLKICWNKDNNGFWKRNEFLPYCFQVKKLCFFHNHIHGI